jgi:DNA-binding NtrC family response regulator
MNLPLPATAPTLDVLIVDDEPLICRFVSDVITLSGHDARAVESPATALQELQRRACNLVITDIRMPCMNGLDLAVTIRETYPWVRILLMSGHYSDVPLSDPRHRAVDGFLSKPFSITQLMHCVEQATGGSSIPAA